MPPSPAERLRLLRAAKGVAQAMGPTHDDEPALSPQAKKAAPPKKTARVHPSLRTGSRDKDDAVLEDPIPEGESQSADWSPTSFVTYGKEWRIRVDPYNIVLENKKTVVSRKPGSEGQERLEWVVVGYPSSFKNAAATIAKYTTINAVRSSKTVADLADAVATFADEIEIHLDESLKEMIHGCLEEAKSSDLAEEVHGRIRDIRKALPARSRKAEGKGTKAR